MNEITLLRHDTISTETPSVDSLRFGGGSPPPRGTVSSTSHVYRAFLLAILRALMCTGRFSNHLVKTISGRRLVFGAPLVRFPLKSEIYFFPPFHWNSTGTPSDVSLIPLYNCKKDTSLRTNGKLMINL